MDDQAKYLTRPKFEGKSEVFRVYYNQYLTSFDLFLWMEQYAIHQLITNKWYIFKAFPTNSIDTIMICKN